MLTIWIFTSKEVELHKVVLNKYGVTGNMSGVTHAANRTNWQSWYFKIICKAVFSHALKSGHFPEVIPEGFYVRMQMFSCSRHFPVSPLVKCQSEPICWKQQESDVRVRVLMTFLILNGHETGRIQISLVEKEVTYIQTQTKRLERFWRWSPMLVTMCCKDKHVISATRFILHILPCTL